jgi:hypothetical protein
LGGTRRPEYFADPIRLRRRSFARRVETQLDRKARNLEMGRSIS